MDGLGGTDTLVNIENARGTDQTNSLFGNGAANRLRGEGGDDTLAGFDGDDNLFGGAGTDILRGGRGNNFLDGGADNDTISYQEWDGPGGITFTLGAGGTGAFLNPWVAPTITAASSGCAAPASPIRSRVTRPTTACRVLAEFRDILDGTGGKTTRSIICATRIWAAVSASSSTWSPDRRHGVRDHSDRSGAGRIRKHRHAVQHRKRARHRPGRHDHRQRGPQPAARRGRHRHVDRRGRGRPFRVQAARITASTRSPTSSRVDLIEIEAAGFGLAHAGGTVNLVTASSIAGARDSGRHLHLRHEGPTPAPSSGTPRRVRAATPSRWSSSPTLRPCRRSDFVLV